MNDIIDFAIAFQVFSILLTLFLFIMDSGEHPDIFKTKKDFWFWFFIWITGLVWIFKRYRELPSKRNEIEEWVSKNQK
jgi:hypothetical protein